MNFIIRLKKTGWIAFARRKVGIENGGHVRVGEEHEVGSKANGIRVNVEEQPARWHVAIDIVHGLGKIAGAAVARGIFGAQVAHMLEQFCRNPRDSRRNVRAC